ncbi:hypothetical protein ScPMuIL_009639 [Solemya velum]
MASPVTTEKALTENAITHTIEPQLDNIASPVKIVDVFPIKTGEPRLAGFHLSCEVAVIPAEMPNTGNKPEEDVEETMEHSGEKSTTSEKDKCIDSEKGHKQAQEFVVTVPLGGFVPPMLSNVLYSKEGAKTLSKPKDHMHTGPIIGQLIRQEEDVSELSSPKPTKSVSSYLPFQFSHPFPGIDTPEEQKSICGMKETTETSNQEHKDTVEADKEDTTMSSKSSKKIAPECSGSQNAPDEIQKKGNKPLKDFEDVGHKTKNADREGCAIEENKPLNLKGIENVGHKTKTVDRECCAIKPTEIVFLCEKTGLPTRNSLFEHNQTLSLPGKVSEISPTATKSISPQTSTRVRVSDMMSNVATKLFLSNKSSVQVNSESTEEQPVDLTKLQHSSSDSDESLRGRKNRPRIDQRIVDSEKDKSISEQLSIKIPSEVIVSKDISESNIKEIREAKNLSTEDAYVEGMPTEKSGHNLKNESNVHAKNQQTSHFNHVEKSISSPSMNVKSTLTHSANSKNTSINKDSSASQFINVEISSKRAKLKSGTSEHSNCTVADQKGSNDKGPLRDSHSETPKQHESSHTSDSISVAPGTTIYSTASMSYPMSTVSSCVKTLTSVRNSPSGLKLPLSTSGAEESLPSESLSSETRYRFSSSPMQAYSPSTLKGYPCSTCGSIFPGEHQLLLHQNIHIMERSENSYKCVDCSLSFKTLQYLQKHRSTHQVLNRQGKTDVVVPTAENPRPYKCEDCSVAFRLSGHLVKHFRSKMHFLTLKTYGMVPQHCLYNSIEKRLTEMNEKDTKGALTYIQNLINHSTSTETVSVDEVTDSVLIDKPDDVEKDSPCSKNDELNPRESVPSEKPFLSDSEEDEKQLKVKIKQESPNLLTIHKPLENESNDAVGSENVIPESAMSPGPNRCGICRLSFRTLGLLKTHLISHAELRPYVCEYCDAGFTNPQPLKTHLLTHTKERPYVCGQCGRNFAKCEDLKSHVEHKHCQSPSSSVAKSTESSEEVKQSDTDRQQSTSEDKIT